MINFWSILQIVSASAFVGYGLHCIFSDFMKNEFKRFGVEQFRVLTGVLEVLGGVGLFVGFFWHPAAIMSSAGLCLLMFMGTVTRIKVKDSLIQSLPAIVLCVVNALLFFKFIA